MTTEEFSNAIDIALSSYRYTAIFGEQSSIGDINLDEYEKSVFLTQALDNIVKRYFNRNLNAEGEGFDDSTRRQIDFSNLITVSVLTQKAETETDIPYVDSGILLDSSSIKPLFIINEKVKTSKGSYVVVPINYKLLDRMMSKAYNEPLKRLAWRLFNSSNIKNTIELVLRSDSGDFEEYKIRFVRRPSPIVLVDLSNTDNKISIDGVNTITECELNPIVHYEIVEEAVQLILQARGIITNEAKATNNK